MHICVISLSMSFLVHVDKPFTFLLANHHHWLSSVLLPNGFKSLVWIIKASSLAWLLNL